MAATAAVEPQYAPAAEPCVAAPAFPTQTRAPRAAARACGQRGPVTLNAAATAASGREQTISFFSFYLSRVALFARAGAAAPATLLAPDGSTQPYGVQLVEFGKPETPAPTISPAKAAT
jgi:hypothetical protein